MLDGRSIQINLVRLLENKMKIKHTRYDVRKKQTGKLKSADVPVFRNPFNNGEGAIL